MCLRQEIGKIIPIRLKVVNFSAHEMSRKWVVCNSIMYYLFMRNQRKLLILLILEFQSFRNMLQYLLIDSFLINNLKSDMVPVKSLHLCRAVILKLCVAVVTLI